MPLTTSGCSYSPNINSAISTTESNQQEVGGGNKVHTLVINVQNTPLSIVKNSALSFTKNIEGTHHDACFTKATSFHKTQYGTWLANPIHLERKNKTEKSRVVFEEIKKLKSLISDVNQKAMQHCNNNSEHVIAQSVLCQKLTGIKANKQEMEALTSVRSILVNKALAYQENKELHENHTGTRWIIKINSINEDVSKYNTIDVEKSMYFADAGEIYRVINGGIGKDISKILAHEQQRVQFGKDVSTLLREQNDISSAIQLNQLEYANQINFKNRRKVSLKRLRVGWPIIHFIIW